MSVIHVKHLEYRLAHGMYYKLLLLLLLLNISNDLVYG